MSAPDQEELGRLGEALEADLADRLGAVRPRSPSASATAVGDQHLAGQGAADDAVGEVDVGAEVVAVAVDGLRRSGSRPAAAGARGSGRGGPTAHSVSEPGSGETTITSSPIVFTIVASGGSVDSTVCDEVLDHVERLDVALLLGVAGEAGEVDEAEGDRDLVRPASRRSPSSLSMWPTTSCSRKKRR